MVAAIERKPEKPTYNHDDEVIPTKRNDKLLKTPALSQGAMRTCHAPPNTTASLSSNSIPPQDLELPPLTRALNASGKIGKKRDDGSPLLVSKKQIMNRKMNPSEPVEDQVTIAPKQTSRLSGKSSAEVKLNDVNVNDTNMGISVTPYVCDADELMEAIQSAQKSKPKIKYPLSLPRKGGDKKSTSNIIRFCYSSKYEKFIIYNFVI